MRIHNTWIDLEDVNKPVSLLLHFLPELTQTPLEDITAPNNDDRITTSSDS